MFEAPTQDELMEQELDPLMREALLAVDPEEAEHFKVTKEAFQRVDIKKKYGVKRLREVVERNLQGDRASPMKSTPSWVHELVPTKHEGVAKIHLERVERKGTWTVRHEFEDSFVVPADLPRAFRQKTKSSNFPAKNGKHTFFNVFHFSFFILFHFLSFSVMFVFLHFSLFSSFFIFSFIFSPFFYSFFFSFSFSFLGCSKSDFFASIASRFLVTFLFKKSMF